MDEAQAGGDPREQDWGTDISSKEREVVGHVKWHEEMRPQRRKA